MGGLCKAQAFFAIILAQPVSGHGFPNEGQHLGRIGRSPEKSRQLWQSRNIPAGQLVTPHFQHNQIRGPEICSAQLGEVLAHDRRDAAQLFQLVGYLLRWLAQRLNLLLDVIFGDALPE
jgi:hypothetical protein